jgi:hypothetical protein
MWRGVGSGGDSGHAVAPPIARVLGLERAMLSAFSKERLDVITVT